MSSDYEKFEKQLRTEKIARIKLLASALVQLKQNEFKDYQIDEDKPIAYYNATIDILNRQVANAELGKAKLIKFDKLEQDRANLTAEELKQLQEEQAKQNKKVDSYLATLDPRASLKGRIHAPNSIILRYRGQGIDPEFSKIYPFGVLL